MYHRYITLAKYCTLWSIFEIVALWRGSFEIYFWDPIVDKVYIVGCHRFWMSFLFQISVIFRIYVDENFIYVSMTDENFIYVSIVIVFASQNNCVDEMIIVFNLPIRLEIVYLRWNTSQIIYSSYLCREIICFNAWNDLHTLHCFINLLWNFCSRRIHSLYVILQP